MTDPFISIVTGTYNRLSFLQKLVTSVRSSVGVGILYEIVIVDGGSRDGTQRWCKQQADIVLIEQGELLGAVKAFNAGAMAARGRYVILANDDISFIDESIRCAISFMEDNLDVGIGCFYQDRRGWDWHVEQMSAWKNGKAVSVYYGQVCIVPKWLGDKVGWWGDYLRTYGGDNELSCNVIELGLKILPVPCACIHDYTPSDDLRTMNTSQTTANGNHPDTQKWLDKWTHGGKLGPTIPDEPKIASPLEPQYRILYAPIYEHNHPIQKSQKRGLRKALQNVALVTEVDYLGEPQGTIYDIAAAFKPHMFIMQIQSIDQISKIDSEGIVELRSLYPNSVFVNWNGDYHPEHLRDSRYMQMLKHFDITGLVTTDIASIYNREGITWFYWQIGYEESTALPDRSTPHYDVLFLGNGYSEVRKGLITTLRERISNFGLYGSWPLEFRPIGNTLYDFDAGHKLYKHCKIAIGDSQWPNARGFVSNRLFQAMYAGAFLLHQYFDGMTELLGLRDGEHLVVWKTVDELLDKIDFYLRHDKERKAIARCGHDFVLNGHSFDMRVSELIAELQRVGSL